jgi:predicted naringenin-chalcone synthase
MSEVCISRISTATPPHDVHSAFVDYAADMLEGRERSLLRAMARRSAIDHRYSFVRVNVEGETGSVNGHVLYRTGNSPATAKRMELFEQLAPELQRQALDKLALTEEERRGIGHVIITCCTGLFAPGLDFTAIDYLGLDPGTERSMVGFMGCYAAINGLKLARHIVRSQPDKSVLMINLELCSLHFQETNELEKILAFLLFADGCSASLIRSGDKGIVLDSFRAVAVPQTKELISWRVGDAGFNMELSSRVPGELRRAMQEHAATLNPDGEVDLWAVHPGGRAILDAVEEGLALAPDKLTASRSVLRAFGNMSSATVMFVIEQLMSTAQRGQRGCAMSFGPGLTAETMNFHVL